MEGAIQQVLAARQAYDQRLHTLLDDEGYAWYREHEESKPAAAELERILEFAESRQLQGIDPALQETLAGLIRETAAYTEQSWHGPYDSLPQVGWGTESVVAQAREQMQSLLTRGAELIGAGRDAGIPETDLTMLQEYYANWIQSQEALVDRLTEYAGTRSSNDPAVQAAP